MSNANLNLAVAQAKQDKTVRNIPSAVWDKLDTNEIDIVTAAAFAHLMPDLIAYTVECGVDAIFDCTWRILAKSQKRTLALLDPKYRNNMPAYLI